MRIIVKWSNGMTSELEVEVPVGATPTQMSFSRQRAETALHQREDERWECLSIKPGGGWLGYCLPDEMVKLMAAGHPVQGLSWDETQSDPCLATALAYCPGSNRDDWQRGRQQRQANQDKFHFHGHGTEQEAINCYQEFLKDFGELEPV